MILDKPVRGDVFNLQQEAAGNLSIFDVQMNYYQVAIE